MSLLTCGKKRQNRGFTLLELLISIVMMVMIVVIAGGAMRLGAKAVVAGEKGTEALERYRMTLWILNSQIQSHVPLSWVDKGVKTFYFNGEKKTMTIATNYSIWGGLRGHTVVTYNAVNNEEGTQALHASERIAGMESSRDVKMLDGLQDIEFSYYLEAVGDEEGKWVESWAEDAVMPGMIR
jgi:prepilin-type N-terminal cleavage/methylation domain-containing protein